MDIYQRLKVKTYINAWDAVSAYGSSRMEPETLAAMRDAADHTLEEEEIVRVCEAVVAAVSANFGARLRS